MTSRRPASVGDRAFRNNLLAYASPAASIGQEVFELSDQNRATVERYFAAVSAKDFDALDAIRHDEFVQEWHQMNERTRGKLNARQINEHHPGLPRAQVKRILGGDEYWVAETTLTYGDGSVWDAVNIFEFRNGKVLRQTDYFCQPLPAPAWRSAWVEPIV